MYGDIRIFVIEHILFALSYNIFLWVMDRDFPQKWGLGCSKLLVPNVRCIDHTMWCWKRL